ncbi:MAG TPA: hypothetical protein VM100_00270 [Longimicrobiales bacterium]|nr:hypothetical protein [Longimicrobiales bacterium]
MLNALFARRDFLKSSLGASAGLLRLTQLARAKDDSLPAVRMITNGPKHHWFGYYDKLEFDPTNRYVLGMEVDFEHRQPTPEEQISLGMVDLQNNDRWIELGHSTAWCWQQGCMLQWIPNSQSDVIWNDREDGKYASHILNVESKDVRTVPHPIYALTPDGQTALSVDFSRLNDVRPGYGYVGIEDPNAADLTPENTGIFRVDLASGESQLLFSVREIAKRGAPLITMKNAKHYFIHVLANPYTSRFIFLHRWIGPLGTGTRMFTAGLDGRDIRLIDHNGFTSHFIWRDATHILAFSNQPSHGTRFYLFEDAEDGKIEAVGPNLMTEDGHATFLRNTDWILSDTYPGGSARMQNPYLYHVPTNRRVSLGLFHSPPAYHDAWRCDTHPRASRDGGMAVIDSPDARSGRQLFLIDLSNIVS